MEKKLVIINSFALAITLVINYLSNTGIFNGKTMSDISGMYENYFTPAGYAFSIWGLIYLGLAGFVFYTAIVFSGKNHEEQAVVIRQTGLWFLVSCIANCGWILAWLYDYIGLSVIIMIILLLSLINIFVRNGNDIIPASFRKRLLVFWPFAIYTGWICVALVANIAAFLTKIEWDGFGLSEHTWTIIMIIIASIPGIILTWQRNMFPVALVGIWALIAVGMANREEEDTLALTAYGVAAVILLNTLVYLFLRGSVKNKKRLFPAAPSYKK